MELPRKAREQVESAAAEPSDPGALADSALALIRARPGITCRELLDGLGLARATALERPLAALLAAGHVRREGDDDDACYFPADLPPRDITPAAE